MKEKQTLYQEHILEEIRKQRKKENLILMVIVLLIIVVSVTIYHRTLLINKFDFSCFYCKNGHKYTSNHYQEYCTECDEKIEYVYTKKICVSCDKIIEENNKYCASCGGEVMCSTPKLLPPLVFKSFCGYQIAFYLLTILIFIFGIVLFLTKGINYPNEEEAKTEADSFKEL